MTDPLAAVRVILKGDVVIASLEGEVDLSNAHDIREDILASIPNTAAGLILDLTKTVYLDSQGIQVLLDVTELLGVRQQRIRLIVPRPRSSVKCSCWPPWPRCSLSIQRW